MSGDSGGGGGGPGCLIIGAALFFIWLYFSGGGESQLQSSTQEPELEATDCSIYIGETPPSLDELSSQGEGDLESFFNDTNPFPQSPEIAMYRILIAIQERQYSVYESSMEESAIFLDQDKSAGIPGRFANVEIHTLSQDEQIAKIQVKAIWTPSNIGNEYPHESSLFFCQRVNLVMARKKIGLTMGEGGAKVDVGLNLSGWFLQENQFDLIPYNLSNLFEEILEEEQDSYESNSSIPTVPPHTPTPQSPTPTPTPILE